jgi:hypothetical protein
VALADRPLSAYLDRAGVSEQVTGERFLPHGMAALPASPAERVH